MSAHGHEHGHHDHSHTSSDAEGRAKALGWAIAITLGFAGVEAVGGWWAGSLALLGDAGHMVTDTVALALSFLAARLAQRPPSPEMSYGWRRAEVLAALLNAVFMLILVVALGLAAIGRLQQPVPVQGGVVMLIAAIGLGVNLLVLWQLHGTHSHALNMRGAVLHVIGDLLGSVAALIAGLVVWLTGWTPIDPLLTLLICGLILVSAGRLLRDVIRVLMEATPPGTDLDAVRRRLGAVEGVVAVHDLHVWTLAGDRLLLSAHLSVDSDQNWPATLMAAQRRLRDEFGIGHATLQPESPQYRQLARAADDVLDDHCH
ncbi:cation diffusion facilitator family transporter [Pseudomarimonas salicorniae]|uniref:Cation diffusion facilitator family transporter n=1 Tax=Pseudomarimonas salicorniae TaxID=2933270 RepID=A0ABT0GHK5_9GAMM|nr:cation diffusion facilitator family transporter [Lysobacter sp. CAU 1642]MCK7594010.1 cation diffusion facilitator family transporter [Lysobacter sp. CAU 1642]